MNVLSAFVVSVLCLGSSPSTAVPQVTAIPVQKSLKVMAAISVTRPVADVTWFAGSGNRYPVEWTKTGIFEVANVHVNLYDESSTRLFGWLANNTPNDGSESVEPRFNQAEGRYTVRVETTDGKTGGTSKPFFIKTSPFIITAPAGALVRGRTYTIGWRTTEPSSLRVDILLRRDGAVVGETLLARQVPNSGRAELRIPSGVVPGSYRFEIQPGGIWGGMSFLSAPVRISS